MTVATDVLRAEHRAIGRMLEVAGAVAAGLRRGNTGEGATLEKLIDFFRNFTDRCHHRKEEDVLFPLLVEKGVPVQNGPIGVMLDEHQRGRAFIAQMVRGLEDLRAGVAGAAEALAGDVDGYVSLLREHIAKEDGVLFPLADRMLAEAEQRELSGRFNEIEEKEMGEGVHERYHHLIHELLEQYGLMPGSRERS